MSWRDVPIPPRMRHLERDRRGYPVPVIVMHDERGQPIFAANDEQERQRCFAEDACHICGRPLLRGRWFVGGHLSACAEHGQFMDGPLHGECARYALHVCPYLAAPSYAKLVGAAQVKARRPGIMVVKDDTEDNARPTFFVALMAVAEEHTYGTVLPGVRDMHFVRLVRPKDGAVRQVELWRGGAVISDRSERSALKAETAAAIAAVPDTPREDVWRLWQ